MASKFARFNLAGIKQIIIKTHYVAPKAGSSFDLLKRATTKFAKESNPSCNVELIDISRAPYNAPIDITPVAEITFEHGITHEFEVLGSIPELINQINNAKDKSYFEPKQEVNDEDWEEEMHELIARGIAMEDQKQDAARERRKLQAKPRPATAGKLLREIHPDKV
mmetsp:Transcript_4734/g.11151  ORF Transcript_4734/g.11151 Transcript_4734/m.11151 type:complete len:166 (-) Transcript_4734:313-810(-)